MCGSYLFHFSHCTIMSLDKSLTQAKIYFADKEKKASGRALAGEVSSIKNFQIESPPPTHNLLALTIFCICHLHFRVPGCQIPPIFQSTFSTRQPIRNSVDRLYCSRFLFSQLLMIIVRWSVIRKVVEGSSTPIFPPLHTLLSNQGTLIQIIFPSVSITLALSEKLRIRSSTSK